MCSSSTIYGFATSSYGSWSIKCDNRTRMLYYGPFPAVKSPPCSILVTRRSVQVIVPAQRTHKSETRGFSIGTRDAQMMLTHALITRWNPEPLYHSGLPIFPMPFSPVHNAPTRIYSSINNVRSYNINVLTKVFCCLWYFFVEQLKYKSP